MVEVVPGFGWFFVKGLKGDFRVLVGFLTKENREVWIFQVDFGFVFYVEGVCDLKLVLLKERFAVAKQVAKQWYHGVYYFFGGFSRIRSLA